MNKICTFMVVLALCTYSYAAEEQTSEPVDAGNEASDAEKAAQIENAPVQKKPASKRGDDIFNPSEDISEDFAVSFPVDI